MNVAILILYLNHDYSHVGYFDVKEVNAIMEESVKMKQFKHPNVMNLIGVCMDAGPAPYIVMPFMANGSLLSYLRKERPNLILDETADEDSVRIILPICRLRGLYYVVATSYASEKSSISFQYYSHQWAQK